MLKRKCSICKEEKELNVNNFYQMKTSKYHYWCRPCCTTFRKINKDKFVILNKKLRDKNKERYKRYGRIQVLKSYGLSLDDFDKLLKAQNYKCGICSTGEPGGQFKQWHVDHCHKTAKVRGILCNLCNRALGQFKDNIDILNSAVNYLQKSKHA